MVNCSGDGLGNLHGLGHRGSPPFAGSFSVVAKRDRGGGYNPEGMNKLSIIQWVAKAINQGLDYDWAMMAWTGWNRFVVNGDNRIY